MSARSSYCSNWARGFEYEATASAAAPYLLRTLTEDRIIHTDNPILPCCGNVLIADENSETVTITGCPNGIDWSIVHDGTMIRLTAEKGVQTLIDKDGYRNEVYRFADEIEDFCMHCSPQKPEGDFEAKGYLAFWNEWYRRRK